MKIGIYDMYLDSLGGGEKYTLNIAECLRPSHDVTVFWNDRTILKKAEDRFHLDLSGVRIQPNIFQSRASQLKKMLTCREYDALFFMSDGSIPLLYSHNNILMFQFPVDWVKSGSLGNRMKMKQFSHAICYSFYVKQFIDRTFNINAQVIPPAVDIPVKHLKKTNTILTVGRFTKAMNHKKQQVMIDAFKQMCDEGLKGWIFILMGSVLPEDTDFVKELRQQAKEYPIEIYTDVVRDELVNTYARAKIYWHATGFGEDLIRHPERVEHFGISTVEAMIEGAVPVVIKAGGQEEIVQHGEDGFLWKTIEELRMYTRKLIEDNQLREEMAKQAQTIRERFSKKQFCEAMNALVA